MLFSLDVERIVQRCIQMGKPEYAAVLLVYLPEEKKEKYVNVSIYIHINNVTAKSTKTSSVLLTINL